MADVVSDLYYIDSIDIWNTYGIGVEGGSDDLLKIPEAKERLSHDWLDEDGIDVDLSRTFFKSRDVILSCFGMAKTREEFWSKYDQFITLLRKPGPRRLSIARHAKDYFVYYKDNNAMRSFNFTKSPSGRNIFTKFTLTLNEYKPSFDYTPTFLTDESGRFIIT